MIPRFNTLLELLDHTFSSHGDLPAYTCLGHTLSFNEVDDLSQRFASYLHHELGLEPGDRVALQMPNILQYPVAMYGLIKAGLVVVNTNPLYTARELKHQLVDSGAKALVVLANVAGAASSIVAETKVEHVIVTEIADLHPFPKRNITNFVVKYVKKLLPEYRFDRQINYRDCVAQAAKPLKPFHVDGESLVALQYTGGTTGVSKGAMLSHSNLAANVWQMISHMPEAFEPGKETFVACLPLYHIYAFNLHGLCAFSYGERNLLIPNPRDLDSMVKALRLTPMTVFIGINTLYVALSRFEPFRQLDFSSLKISSAGGMAMTEDATNAWVELTGCDICEGYGLTESSPVLCGNRVDDIHRGTIGYPMVETEIKLVDDDGNTVSQGEIGEIYARGPQIMLGYWQRPEETSKTITEEGFLKTGDMAMLMPSGVYKIVDRKKDMILVSGFNVYPNEIEDVVSQHPSVVEAAAIGIKDSHSGEVVKLFVVPNDDKITVEELSDFCRENLTAYKRPKVIEFKDALPKSNVGKILRRQLRENQASA